MGNLALAGTLGKDAGIPAAVSGRIHASGSNIAAGKEIGNVSIHRGLFDGD